MSRRVLVGFLLLNVLVSVAVAGIVIALDNVRRDDAPPEGPTQIVLITTTPESPLSAGQYQSTIDVQQLTLAALQGSTAVVAVITAAPEAGLSVAPGTSVATINPALLPPIPTDLPPGQPSPTPQGDDGCLRHVVESGDYILSIAQKYGVFAGDILLANGLAEDEIIHIGQVLIIPVAGCTALMTPTPAPTLTNTPFSLVAPTVTLPPATGSAQIAIRSVLGAGSVNDEAVELRNDGEALNLQGWTLTNARGDSFSFPDFRMQRGSVVRVYSKQGENTPAALYWGRETAAWRSGDTLTLADRAGEAQATFVVGG